MSAYARRHVHWHMPAGMPIAQTSAMPLFGVALGLPG
eukprot:CAMPEP_0179407694 /NCGR_PEP_ID=MMETSP0799-20121207/1659_1 /TAXON_ID=46947 /ORGANISM="Geminigera cryophila, Strain CCMP2564" /LENGTH=36 /DNA_ID= /DNA_START= /DNA_END= /DNA_ORIENTATION=